MLRRMQRSLSLAALLCCVASASFADEIPSEKELKWCPPTGPGLSKQLNTENVGSMKPGWVTVQMHVRPGAVPVSDVRVLSEAGGSGLAREVVALVRRWVGCSENERDTIFRYTQTLGLLGNYQLPSKEGIGLNAFLRPRGAPQLPKGDLGVGICPITATVQWFRPEAPNKVIELESKGGDPVIAWLQQIVPDEEYFSTAFAGNRIVFDCRVDNGVVKFYDN